MAVTPLDVAADDTAELTELKAFCRAEVEVAVTSALLVTNRLLASTRNADDPSVQIVPPFNSENDFTLRVSRA